MGRNDEDWAVFWCSREPRASGEIPEAQRSGISKLSREGVACPTDSGDAFRCEPSVGSGAD